MEYGNQILDVRSELINKKNHLTGRRKTRKVILWKPKEERWSAGSKATERLSEILINRPTGVGDQQVKDTSLRLILDAWWVKWLSQDHT